MTPDNFLGLPHDESDYASARFAVLPIPYDATTSYGVGTRDGPRAIITASQQVELYDEGLGCEPKLGGVATLDPVAPDARGPEQTLAGIFKAAKKVVADGKFLLSLGGEHSISSALVKAVKTRNKDLSVLQIDAHADLRDEYQGSPFSHASVMRRIHDLGVDAVAVGIRNYSAAEARFIRENEKLVLSPRDVRDMKNWIDVVINALSPTVYVTIDIDGFDPAYAPGTGTPEPGGLDWFQVTDLLARVSRKKNIVAADIVEVRPIPPSTVTEFLAARLAHRLMGLVSMHGK
ncbi:N(1)-aminopropylagmatine ureohydrolase [Phycisphaerae bacterium RAS1]|nr:N(1)-aminopropylagmatine ureohydrolase [Phycisphaerae bacterium RAS1]